MYVHVIQSNERRIWVYMLDFFSYEDPDKKKNAIITICALPFS